MKERIFVSGMYVKLKGESAPDYVLCGVNFKIADFEKMLAEFKKDNPGEEWMNTELKVAQSGNGYVELNQWKPNKQPAPSGNPAPAAPPSEFKDDDIPF